MTTGLAPLFANERPEVGFRQGVVIFWDEQSGQNQVDVGGTLLTNLPCLNIGDFVILQAGDVVGLLRFQSTYFILGRMILPTGPDLNRAVVAFDRGSAETDTAFPITTTPTTRATITLTPPAWVDEALIMVGIMGQGTSTGTDLPSFLSVRALVNGEGLKGQNVSVAPGGNTGNATAIDSAIVLAVGGSPITIEGQIWATDDYDSSTSNDVSLTALAVYRRTG